MKNQNPQNDKGYIPFLRVVRLLFIIMVTYLTFGWAKVINPYIIDADLKWYTIFGFLISLILVFIEKQIQNAFPQELMVGLFGLLCGALNIRSTANRHPGRSRSGKPGFYPPLPAYLFRVFWNNHRVALCPPNRLFGY